MLAAGDRVSTYDLEELVASGPTGLVFRARDRRLGRLAAVRVVSPEVVDDPLHRARLNREASVLAQLDHPNVPPLYDADEAEGTIFLASRWVDGTPLDKLVADKGPLQSVRAVRLVSQVAAALQAAHDMGLVHRSVKPAHVLVTSDDHVYLTDFGLARRQGEAVGLTDPGHLAATLDNTAPELIRGDEVDARADIYGLGLVLYEALTGRRPFERPGGAASLYEQASAEAPSLLAHRPELPPELDEVVQTALAKNPGARQQSAAEFAQEAAAAVAVTVPGWVRARSRRPHSTHSEPLAPTVDGTPSRNRRGRRLLRLALVVVGLAVFIAVPAALVLTLRDTDAGVQTEKLASRAYGVAAGGGRVWVATGKGLGVLPDALRDERMRVSVKGIGPVTEVASGRRRTVMTTPHSLVTVSHGPNGGKRPETVRIREPADALARGAGASWIGLAERGALLRVAGRTRTSVPLLDPPSAIAVGARTVWVASADAGTVFGVDPATLEAATKKVRVGRRPIAMAATPNAIWVVVAGDGKLVRLDPSSGRPEGAPVPIPGVPSAVAADAREVWVTRRGDDAVTRIDAKTGRPIDEVGTARRPVGVTLTNDAAWVVGARGEVTRIPR